MSSNSLLAEAPYTAKIKRTFMGLAKRIEDAIRDSGLTKAAVARRLEVSPQAVNGWIKTGTIDKARLIQLAGITGKTVEELVTGKVPDTSHHGKAGALMDRLLRSFHEMREPEQRALVEYADLLLLRSRQPAQEFGPTVFEEDVRERWEVEAAEAKKKRKPVTR